MATTFQGLLVRDSFDDIGQIPSPSATWPFSPDIIPYGTGNFTPGQATSTWSNRIDQGVPVVNGSLNNIYVRCQNIATGPTTGTANLFYVNSSLMLFPTTWNQVASPSSNTLVTADGSALLNIPPATRDSHGNPVGGIGIVQAPFQLGGIPNNAHYCWVCVVNNNGVPTVVPQSFPNNSAFVMWIRSNQSVSFRNIVLGAGVTGTINTFHTFGNANPIASTMIISMTGVNLPAGTTWATSCNDLRLPQPFSANGTFSSSGTGGTQLTVPASIDGTTGNAMMSMAFTFTNPGGAAFPSNAKVTIDMYQVPSTPALRFEKEASRVHRVAPTAPPAARGARSARASSGAVGKDGRINATLIHLGAVEVWLTTQ